MSKDKVLYTLNVSCYVAIYSKIKAEFVCTYKLIVFAITVLLIYVVYIKKTRTTKRSKMFLRSDIIEHALQSCIIPKLVYFNMKKNGCLTRCNDL